MARWRLLVVLVLAASLAGCFRPFASDADPDRESVNVPRGEFFGEPLTTNGTMRISLLPGEAVGPVSEEPYNCLIIEDADDERESFLGGISVDLVWTPTSSMTETLNLTVDSYRMYGDGSVEGRSPLHLALVDPLDVDSTNTSYRTPITIRVAPVGLAVPIPDQPIEWTVKVGILESAITGIRWRHCEPGDLVQPPILAQPAPVPRPPAAVPRTSSILAG